MNLLKKRSTPRQKYIGECLKCKAIVEYTEEEYVNLYKFKLDLKTICVDCEICSSEASMFIYNSTTQEAQNILAKI